jgi:hypothetical protein
MSAEKFTSILKSEKTQELVPFLKSLDKEGKKEVATALKPLAKDYLELKLTSSMLGSTYKQKASPDQQHIIHATAFVVYNRKDYEKLDGAFHILSNQFLPQILVWYCPDWFGNAINDITKHEWMPWSLRYDFVMTLAERNYINPSDELISRLIPDMIFERNEKHQHIYTPQNLLKRKITCEQHIWLIFSYETSINHADRFYNADATNKDEKRWLMTIKTYADQGVIDRQRILKESLLATCKNFTKPLSGWFVELFELMSPSTSELISLQPELLSVLSSQNSKAVNLSLSMLKLIVEDKAFNVASFMDNTQIVLSSDTKSVVTSTLTLLEKIGRKILTTRPQIAHVACQAFIHNDENIQQKAAKLILKFYEPSMSSVEEEVTRYAQSMLMSAKKALADLIRVNPEEEALPVIATAAAHEQTYEPVDEITTLDELIFLASQAFDNNDPLHIDLLPAALVSLQNKIAGQDLHKLEPALQRAYNFVMNDWPSTMGYLDHLLATFFIDTSKLLIARYPEDGVSLNAIHQTYRAKDRENGFKWKWYQSRIMEFTTWSVQSRDTTYIIHKALLLGAYGKIEAGSSLPMLSTPTHQQGFIDPLVLVARLQKHQTENVLPDNLDFQVAISRLAPLRHAEALSAARSSLHGEMLHIMEFILDKDAQPSGPFGTDSLWFIAGVTKSPSTVYPQFNKMFFAGLPRSVFTGDVPWKTFTEHFKTTRYNFQLKKNEEIPDQRNVLKLSLNPAPTIWKEPDSSNEGLLKKVKNFFASPKGFTRSETYLLYEYLSLKNKFISAEANDVQRFIHLFPSNPNPVLTLMTARALEHGTFPSETDKKLVTKTLEALINRKFYFSEITHLFMSACLIASDKTVKSLAAELWITAVNNGHINNLQLGRMMGIHLAVGYAPMKRLTDLVSSNLIKISSTHDRALLSMLEETMENLPAEPPVGTKRLLELYSELLSLNNLSVTSPRMKDKLEAWSTSASMKKTIASLV